MDQSIKAGIIGTILAVFVSITIYVPAPFDFLPIFLIAIFTVYVFRLSTLKDGLLAVFMTYVFNSGILAGGTTFDYAPAPPEVVARAQELEALCGRHGVPLAAAALQFPVRHPAVASVLLGPRSPAQLAQSLDLLDVAIPEGLWAELAA